MKTIISLRYSRSKCGNSQRRRNFINISYGYTHIDKQLKVTSNTVFELGSVTKLLVWTSVMQLVEQGTLDLNENIRTYLPDGFLTNIQYDSPITMLHLMHHNAGWEDRFIFCQ